MREYTQYSTLPSSTENWIKPTSKAPVTCSSKRKVKPLPPSIGDDGAKRNKQGVVTSIDYSVGVIVSVKYNMRIIRDIDRYYLSKDGRRRLIGWTTQDAEAFRRWFSRLPEEAIPVYWAMDPKRVD